MIEGLLKKLSLWVLAALFVFWQPYSQVALREAVASDFSVMIIPLPDPSSKEYSLIDGLAKAFKDTGKFDVVSKHEVENFVKSKTGGIQAKNLYQIYNEASGLLKKGEGLYNSLKIDEAISVLGESKLKFKESLPSITDQSRYSRFLGTFFYLGMAYQSKDMQGQARQELREMIVMDPRRGKRKFSSKYYPPRILELYEKTKKEVLKGEYGKLRVKTKPSQAKLYIDGLYAGDTPFEMRLPVGEHFLILKRDGYTGWSDSLFIVEGPNTVEKTLKQEAAGSGYPKAKPVKTSYDISKEVANFLDEMSISLGGDLFLLYEFSTKGKKAKLAAQLYDQRNQQVSKIEEVRISDVDDAGSAFAMLASRLVGYLNPEGYVVADLPSEAPAEEEAMDLIAKPDDLGETVGHPDLYGDSGKEKDWQTLPPKKPGSPKQWYEKGWVWGVIAGGLAITTGSILLFTGALKSSASKSTFRIDK